MIPVPIVEGVTPSQRKQNIHVTKAKLENKESQGQ
jgi:hypothetical protein